MEHTKKLKISNEFQGKKFKVVHCHKALKTFDRALAHVSPTNKQKTMIRAMISQIQRLANGERMSEESFRREAALPKLNGHTKVVYFYAFKRKPIRGYCWESIRYPGVYFISHYINKDYDKLSPDETKVVENNWRRIEENGDEC